MTSGVELATAWVRLVPSAEGIQGELTKQLAPEAEKAGDDAGKKSGTKFSASMKTALLAGSAVLVAGVVGAFKGLYEIGDTFDEVTDTIRAGTGAQGAALDGLVQTAKDVGNSVPADFDKVGQTVADLNTRMGLSGDTLKTVASQYLEAGRVLGQDVDINTTTAAFNAFKIQGDDVVGAMDTLFQVSQATGVGMNDLASIVQTAAPALQNLGFSFEDSAALAGTLDKAGLNTGQVMASLSKGLVTLAKDGEAPQEAFKRVTGELQGFVDTGDTAAALDLASQVFGTRGAAQFVGALQAGTLNMEDLMGATGATGDTILGVGEDTMDFAEKAKILGNQAQTALEPLATAVFSAMGDALTAVMPLLQGFGAWLADNTYVIGIAAGVIGTVLVAAFFAWAASIWAANAALLASPITWIILGIVALIAAVVALVVNWDAVVAWITTVWNGFLSWFTGVMDGFFGWWNGIWAAISQFFIDVWNNIVSFFTSIWNGIVSWFTGLVTGIVTFLATALTNIQNTWNNVWNGISSFFGSIWNGIVSYVQNYITNVGNIISGALNWISSVWNNMWNGMVDFFGSVFGGIVGIAKAPINGVISLINGAISALNAFQVTIPDWVPGIGGQTWGLSIPHIPMLAKGGTITRSGYTIVGENGPEVLKLPTGAQVNPNYDSLPTDSEVAISEADMDMLAAKIYAAIVAVRQADGRSAALMTKQGVR